jgi:pyridoxal phosphate enzyme (YggS family)
MRRTSPCTRIMGGKPEDKCRSEALFLTAKVSSSEMSIEIESQELNKRLIMSVISENWQATLSRVRLAAQNAGRAPDSVKVLAVSKTFPLPALIEAAAAGATAFGENYVQEGIAKIDAWREQGQARFPGVEWHFIGPLQSNKTRLVAEYFDWVHSVDRLKIAERLSSQRPTHLPALQVCVQVNISRETSKSGAMPEEVVTLAQQMALLPRLKVRGLMAIPEPQPDFVRQRTAFAALQHLWQQCRQAGLPMDTLSMGMSADLEAAIAEGATLVRVGTAIFGQRTG